jgi:hypothetical protein
VSAQALTYPQKSCCSATAPQVLSGPSGFALMFANSLILLGSEDCCENGQGQQILGKSRLWGHLAQLAHKVIHKNCGQQRKRFSIIDLDRIPNLNPSFRTQLRLDWR